MIVEDSAADIFLIREAIEASVDVSMEIIPDGEKAVAFFAHLDEDNSARCPDLVVLDVNLPRKTGDQVLTWLRSTRRSSSAKVLVVTSSGSAVDRNAMQSRGADAYFRKPSELDEFMKLGEIVRDLLSNHLAE